MWRLSRSLRPGLEPFTRLMAKVLMPSCTWPQLIVASELAQSIGLALCTQWVQQLEGVALSELDVQTLDLVKAALVQRTQKAASG